MDVDVVRQLCCRVTGFDALADHPEVDLATEAEHSRVTVEHGLDVLAAHLGGAPEIGELLGHRGGRDELGNDAFAPDHDRCRAVAEERLELGLGLGETRVGSDYQGGGTASPTHAVERRAQRPEAGPHRSGEVRDRDLTGEIRSGGDDAR